MKLLYVIKSLANKAGTERVLIDKMNWLAARNYEIIIVTYEQGSHSFAYPLDERIRHIDLNTRFFELGKLGFLTRIIEFVRLRIKLELGLKKVVEELKPDIVIATTYMLPLFKIILNSSGSAIKVLESHIACHRVIKSDGYSEGSLKNFICNIYYKLMLRCVGKFDLLVALTNGDALEWRKYIKNVVVIPNPVTNIPKSLLPKQKTCRIIAVGRLEEQKGFDLLIDAFVLFAEKNSEWKLDIFGEGGDELSLRKRITINKLENRISIHPSTSDIYKEYQMSDFLVMSSRYEGFALVLLEAQACGLPIVAFKCKYGPEDIINDGYNGLLVDSENVEDMANKMLWMTEHTYEMYKMGENARKMVKEYDTDVVLEKWNSLFNKIKR